MKNILIIGANGFTGRRILNDLSKCNTFHVVGCSLREDILPQDTHQFIQADIRDEKQVEELFETVRPEVVINTSALSVPDYCETHHAEAWATNTDAVERLARFCEAYQSRFIHLSTDFVFDGKGRQLYTEDDKPAPVNYYGVTKLAGEERVQQLCSNYAIVRVVVVYGKALPGQHGNILQLVANKLSNGEPVRVVSDQWRTPTFVGDVSAGVKLLIEKPLNGIFHICGSECYSISEIAYRVASYLQLDSSLIQPVTTAEMGEATPRPQFSGLSNAKAHKELSFLPIALEQGLIEMFG
ncbi:SDR family oxidoreductase [Bacteroides sp. 51]|uniref:SDR family oxidoreductase n=1 Tax=Bacteroides sp. 51 TaxID=2302938 RepID=UPI0013D3FCCC|nr:SDR family oxidoreductase [Bacteroides sp. 51]NDV82898.1 SDR family oxidoreductase [Bacteroides sp. 51]